MLLLLLFLFILLIQNYIKHIYHIMILFNVMLYVCFFFSAIINAHCFALLYKKMLFIQIWNVFKSIKDRVEIVMRLYCWDCNTPFLIPKRYSKYILWDVLHIGFRTDFHVIYLIYQVKLKPLFIKPWATNKQTNKKELIKFQFIILTYLIQRVQFHIS